MTSIRSYKTESGDFDLNADVIITGQDLVVVVTGGKAHLGGTATATPRPSLADPQKTSADLTSQAITGHKDDTVARLMAKDLSSGLNTRVMVAVGCHWDNIDKEGLNTVFRNVDNLTNIILTEMKTAKKLEIA